MGKRAWLIDAIASEYLPFLARLKDTEEGKAEAQQFNEVIRSAWAARGLSELSQQQSLMDNTRRAIKDYLGESHFSLNYIKFSTDEYITLNDTKQGRVAERNEQIQFLDDPDAIVLKAIALLQSPEWSEIAAGLSVLTGRRSSEILSTAQFTKCSEWSVMFTGALKRRGETQILSIEIPTLAQSDAVCTALARVRQELALSVGLDAETVNSKYGSAVIRACDRHFTALVPAREGKDNLYTHLNRSIYATIATFWYCPPRVNDVEFKAAIQGHYAILDEKNSVIRRSLTASRHYSDYEIADAVIAKHGGKRKGVKLGLDGVQVIDAFRNHAESVAVSPTQKHHKLGSVRIWREDKVLLDEIFDRLGLDSHLNQSQRMGALLQWVKAHLGEGKEAIATVSLPEQEIPSSSLTFPDHHPEPCELINETTTPDNGHDETTVAVSQPDVVLKPIVTHSNQTQSEEAIPQPPASGLLAKIDQLIEVMTQFISFSMQSALQLPTTPPTRAKVKATTEVKPTIASKASSGANTTTPTTQQRSKRNSPLSEAAIHQAINAIIAHNNTIELHDLKWAISINAVKELVADVTKSQRLVDKAIKERQAEIDAHHALHQIEPTHNHRHKRKRKIHDAINN